MWRFGLDMPYHEQRRDTRFTFRLESLGNCASTDKHNQPVKLGPNCLGVQNSWNRAGCQLSVGPVRVLKPLSDKPSAANLMVARGSCCQQSNWLVRADKVQLVSKIIESLSEAPGLLRHMRLESRFGQLPLHHGIQLGSLFASAKPFCS